MTPDTIAQAVILILGATAIALIPFEGRRHYWGMWAGLASEPFWLYSSVKAGQWGIVILCFW